MNNKGPVIPTISAETEIIANRLAKLKPGEEVTYSELSKLIRRNVQRDARHILQSARRKAQNDHGVVTAIVRNNGLRRAFLGVYADIASSSLKAATNKARRGLKSSLLMPQNEYADLPIEERARLDVKRSLLAMQVQAGKRTVEQRVLDAVIVQNGRLAIGETLEIAKGGGES